MNLFKAIHHAYRVYSATQNIEILQKLKEYKFDTDWIGRPWFEFEIPNEFFENEQVLNAFVWKKINDHFFLFNQTKIDDIIYPITYVDYKNMKCLVVFSTDLKPIITTFNVLKWLVPTVVVIGILVKLFILNK